MLHIMTVDSLRKHPFYWQMDNFKLKQPKMITMIQGLNDVMFAYARGSSTTFSNQIPANKRDDKAPGVTSLHKH